MPFFKSSDGSVMDENGKVLFFSLEKFESDICSGKCCFICGADKTSKEFNNEHVLPNWLLKKFKLHNRTITLPNLTQFKYGQYVIPCCIDCNSILGKEIEQPVQKLIESGYEAVAKYVKQNGPHLFFTWLSLIFLKTHFKDGTLLFNQNRSSGDDRTISHVYDYSHLHHIHCIARSFYSKAILEPGAIGSFLILPAKQLKHFEHFDFSDLYTSRSILLRIDDIALVAVLDDACGALSLFLNDFKKINGPLSPLQLRELLAHMSYINIYMKDRPKHGSRFNANADEYVITAENPSQVTLIDESERKNIGELIHGLCSHMLKGHPDFEKIDPLLKQGMWHFLFDGNGNFQEDSMNTEIIEDK